MPVALIREDFWRKLCRALQRQPIFKEAEPLRSLTGHQINTIGRTLAELLGEYLEVTIIKRMNHDLLLADDCLRGLGAIIDYNTGIVWLGQNDFQATHWRGEDLRIAITEVEKWTELRLNVFALEETPNGQMPSTMMRIDTRSHAPIWQRAYRTPLRKRKQVEQEIQKMLLSLHATPC